MHIDNQFDKSMFTVVIWMKDLGLYSELAKLRLELQDELCYAPRQGGRIVMYYGKFGNYGIDLTAWVRNHVGFPVEVFRDCQNCICDNCIGVTVRGGGDRRLPQADQEVHRHALHNTQVGHPLIRVLL